LGGSSGTDGLQVLQSGFRQRRDLVGEHDARREVVGAHGAEGDRELRAAAALEHVGGEVVEAALGLLELSRVAAQHLDGAGLVGACHRESARDVAVVLGRRLLLGLGVGQRGLGG